MPHDLTLGYILEHSEKFPWNFALYLPRGSAWGLETFGKVLDPNDCAEDEEDPPAATAAGLRYALSIQDIQSIVENARQQMVPASLDCLLKAFQYYCDHDAFIKFR